MEQILNKLSEIELTAKRIMEDADSTKSALSAELEEKCKEFDAALEQETNTKIQELRSSLEQKKNEELSELRSHMESALCELDSYYSQNHETLSEHLFRKLLAN